MSMLAPGTPEWTKAFATLSKLRIPDDDCTLETATRILAARVEELEAEVAHLEDRLAEETMHSKDY